MKQISDDEPVGRAGGETRDPDPLGSLLASGKSRKRRRWIALLAMGVIIATAAGFAVFRTVGTGKARDEQAYETARITRGDLRSTITATGTVQALNTVEVGAEISGRIASIHADFNDSVTLGQLLAEIDPEQLEAAVNEAEAQVLAARADMAEARAALVEARQDAERSGALAEKGLLSPKELEAATAKAARAAAALQSAQARQALAKASYDSSRTKLGKTEIRAPIAGTVLSRKVEVGQTINAGMQTPVLFVIAEDLKRMRLSSRVDEADIGAVAVGQAASFTVDAYPEHAFTSEVVSVRNVPQTDQNVVSYEVLLTVDNRDLLLKPGMTTTVEITTALQRGVLLVPNKALRFTPPSASRGMGRPPPGLFFLGGPKGKPGQDDPVEALARLGKLDARQAVLWVLDGPRPRPLKVEKLATDGVSTAVAALDLEDGMQALVDVAQPKAE